jgi:hypothetical protein
VTETHNVYVILGNSALLKCQIPSFVSDFVTVESWSDDKGNQFLTDIKDYGKTIVIVVLCQNVLFEFLLK